MFPSRYLCSASVGGGGKKRGAHMILSPSSSNYLYSAVLFSFFIFSPSLQLSIRWAPYPSFSLFLFFISGDDELVCGSFWVYLSV